MNKYSEEVHPWGHFIPAGTTKLFIGTFPTEERNRRHDFFYSSATNRFWDIISEVSNLNGEAEADEIHRRKSMLRTLKLGLTDMGKRILRQQGSSNDHSLFPIEFMDILKILHSRQTINTIILTGDSQGNSSLSWFGIFCSINKIPLDVKRIKKKKNGELILGDRSVQIVVTYSPSRLSRVKTDVIIEAYRSIFL